MSEPILKNLTGYKNAKFFVRRKSDGFLVATINLDECNGDNLIVEYEDVYLEQMFIDYTEGEDNATMVGEQEFQGMWYYWTFNWTELFLLENGLNVRDLLNFRIGNVHNFFLQPRIDYDFVCQVLKVPSTMELRLSKGYELSEGDYGFSFKWKSKSLIKPMYWRDPNVIEAHIIKDFV